MPDTERTPRIYADLLALFDASPVWAPPAVDPATSAAGGAAPVDRLAYATEEEIARALQIDVLGRTEAGEIEVYSEHYRRTTTIGGVSRLRYGDLLLHFGPPTKAAVLKSGQDQVPGMWGKSEVVDALNLLGGRRMIGEETKLGPGCWAVIDEQGRDERAVVLVNSHEAMHYNGSIERITHPRHRGHLLSFDSGERAWYDFEELSATLEKAGDMAFRAGVVDELCRLFGRWRWRGRQIPTLVSSLVLCTWVQSLWAWRPRIDVLGGSGTGKSMLCDALAGLFRGLVINTADTSFPGLAQEMQRAMAAVIVDEIDAKDKESATRQRQIVKGLRSASRGTVRIRGTARQRATKFTLRHLAWIAGISMNYDDQADRNRAIILTLEPPTAEKAGKLILPTFEELRDLGQRSLAVALWGCQDARERAVGLKNVKVDCVDQRAVESYAVPAAMLSVMLGHSEESARELLANMLADVGQDNPVESDERSLINQILGADVQLGSARKTVAQVIDYSRSRTNEGASSTDWRAVMEAVGVKLDLGSPEKIIFRYQALKKLLRGTDWEHKQTDQYLRRVTGAKAISRRVGGVLGRCVVFELDEFRRRFMGSDDSEQQVEPGENW
jgi:hypothetical protein